MRLALSQIFSVYALLSGAHHAFASCEPEISYPPPKYNDGTLSSAFQNIDGNIKKLLEENVFNGTSFSLEISSSNKTLHSSYHHDKSLGGSSINGSSVYRIASNTKLFTALGILKQEAEGNLGLDDEVIKYLPAVKNGSSIINWKGITIRSLLAHISGLPDNYGDLDLLLTIPDVTQLGFPPVDGSQLKALPKCGEYSDFNITCTESGLYDYLHRFNPLFPPQKVSSYSNVGFSLLGEVLAKVTGMKYEEYIEKEIFIPLSMNSTSFIPPDSSVEAQGGSDSAWSQNQGYGNAAGGIYSSSADMIKFLRWALKNGQKITPTLNWFQIAAWSSGSHSFYGYPWEIFRTTEILQDTKRPVTIYTKGGGLDDYFSYSFVIPQYDLVAYFQVAGKLPSPNTIFTSIINPLVKGAEAAAQTQLRKKYGGTYVAAAPNLNSSISFTQSDAKSLHISSWVSNSTDLIATLLPQLEGLAGTSSSTYLQLIPTFRVAYKSGRVGEVWRWINVIDDYEGSINATNVWNDYCTSNIDPYSYAQVPLNEVIFWKDPHSSSFTIDEVTISAFEVDLNREN